jgi:hypothetical protein
MAAIALTAIGIFAIGVVIGVIAMVSHGIHREQRRFDEARRYREEQGIWDASEAPEYFLSDAPDGVSNAARRLNGLYVRHLPTVRPTVRDYDAELAA